MEFDESKHPRDKDGKFTDKGGGEASRNGKSDEEKQREAVRKFSSQPDKDMAAMGLNNNLAQKSEKFVVNTPAARKLYSEIQQGKYYETEQLRNHPVVKELDRISDEYSKRYGKTININTPERIELRKQWESDFLSAGAMQKDKDGEYRATGKIKKEYKAVIAIGLPAAGKSTFVANPVSAQNGAFVFDSDEIKELIPEFKESHGGAANAVHDESKEIQKRAFNKFLKGGERNGDNLVIPVIGDDYEDLQRKYIKKLEDAGYDVEIKYQDADPKRSMNQAFARAIKKGRIIPSNVLLGYQDKPRAVFERLKTEKNSKGDPYVR